MARWVFVTMALHSWIGALPPLVQRRLGSPLPTADLLFHVGITSMLQLWYTPLYVVPSSVKDTASRISHSK